MKIHLKLFLFISLLTVNFNSYSRTSQMQGITKTFASGRNRLNSTVDWISTSLYGQAFMGMTTMSEIGNECNGIPAFAGMTMQDFQTDGPSNLIFTGEAPYDWFGYNVSSAGDVNNDGFDDMIVGAPYNDTGISAPGKVYIYFGGTILNNIPDVILKGWEPGANFGVGVSSAGDVNNDGYSDVIIGAYMSNAGANQGGRAFIYFGGAPMDTTADVILTGTVAGAQFGYCVSDAGDVNGDSISDVIVGANGHNNGGLLRAGSAYIFLGDTTMDNVADVKIIGNKFLDDLGQSVSDAGDINRDGFDDIIIGAQGNFNQDIDSGKAYLYLGGNPMDTTADVIFLGAAPRDRFGVSVSSAGNINGDLYPDIIIGAITNDAGGNDAGRAYIFYGDSSMDNVADVTLTGLYANEHFGIVSSAGDVNGDNFDDVIIGAYQYNSKAYVFFGGEDMNVFPDIILSGEDPSDYFGNSIASAGDINGDGQSDIIVGAVYNDAGGTDAGRAYLYNPFINWLEITNIYAHGQVPLQSSSFDTVGIRIQKNISGTLQINVELEIINLDPPFDVRFDTTIFFPHFNVTDSIFYVTCPRTPNPRNDIIVVQAMPGELFNNNSGAYDTNTYCYSTTSNSYNYSEPCRNADGGTGFDGRTGILVARFKNFDTDTISVSSVDHSFYDGNGSGNKPYKIVLYGDDGSGRPGPLLHVSSQLSSPPSNGSKQFLNYIIDPPVNISANSFFYVGYMQTSGSNIKCAFQFEIPIRTNSFFFKNSGDIIWTDFYDSSKNYRIDISPKINKKLFLKAFFEGFYDGFNMVPDTAILDMRSFYPPYTIIESNKSLLNSNGTGIFNFLKVINDSNYYFVLRHRNHLETWSHPVGERFDMVNKQYDFTDSITKAYGNNMKGVGVSPVRFAIYGGDVDQDGYIDVLDVGIVYNDVQNSVTGYVNTDLNGDDFVEVIDLGIVYNNSNNVIIVRNPIVGDSPMKNKYNKIGNF